MSTAALTRHGVDLVKRARVVGWTVARATVAQAWADRVLGLAAEAGFWALLSLTPLLLVLVAAVGYLTPLFGRDIAVQVEERILSGAGQILAPTAVHQLLEPVLTDVLRHGRGGIISLGFLLALWPGSTAMNTYVNGITIAYGMRDVRSAIKTRLLAFGLYLGALLAGTITLPLLVTAPEWITAAAPAPALPAITPIVAYGYWPTVMVLCTGLLATLYHLAVPARSRWRRDLPGAIAAMLAWLAGSYLLGHTSPSPSHTAPPTAPYPPLWLRSCSSTSSPLPCYSAPNSTPKSTAAIPAEPLPPPAAKPPESSAVALGRDQMRDATDRLSLLTQAGDIPMGGVVDVAP